MITETDPDLPDKSVPIVIDFSWEKHRDVTRRYETNVLLPSGR